MAKAQRVLASKPPNLQNLEYLSVQMMEGMSDLRHSQRSIGEECSLMGLCRQRYRQLIEDGMTAENIAARFGQSVVTVRQRLKLASLSPKILDVLREDAISIDQAKALAITDDHSAQETVWFDGPSWNRAPHSLRAALTNDHVRSTDKLALFVGIEAYEGAGGAILRDLFAEASTTFLTDRALLVKLATDMLEQDADLLRVNGWKWVEPGLDGSGIYNLGYGRIYPINRVPTEDEQAELSQLGAQFDEITARIEDYAEGDPAIEADEAALIEVEQRIEDVQSAGKVYDTDQKALAGCIVTISHSGGLQIEKGLVRPDDLQELRRLRQPETQGGDETSAEEGCIASADDDDDEEQPTAYSAALVEELTAIRTAAMRVEMVSRPQTALTAVLYPLVMQVFHDGPRYLRPASSVEIAGDLRSADELERYPRQVELRYPRKGRRSLGMAAGTACRPPVRSSGRGCRSQHQRCGSQA